jgi:hypothetical protein
VNGSTSAGAACLEGVSLSQLLTESVVGHALLAANMWGCGAGEGVPAKDESRVLLEGLGLPRLGVRERRDCCHTDQAYCVSKGRGSVLSW